MATPRWTYKLRIMKRNPDRFRMDRLAEYMREFADLLGVENNPVFKGLKKESTGLLAALPPEKAHVVKARLVEAKLNPDGRVGKALHRISGLLGEDGIKEARLVDASDNVVYLFEGVAQQVAAVERLNFESTIDGVVTGLVGADSTMHLHLRTSGGVSVRLLIRDEDMAREVLKHFRIGQIRAHARGWWTRSEQGWIPESNMCSLQHFDVLDESPPSVVFDGMAHLDGMGWKSTEDPMGTWEQLRGIN